MHFLRHRVVGQWYTRQDQVVRGTVRGQVQQRVSGQRVRAGVSVGGAVLHRHNSRPCSGIQRCRFGLVQPGNPEEQVDGRCGSGSRHGLHDHDA